MSPPTRNWLGEQPGPIEVDLTGFKSKGRLTIRQPGRALVRWLSEETSTLVVVELAETGRLVIRSWKGFGERILARQEALAKLTPDSDAEIELIGLRERFLRNTIESGGRLLLGDREMLHLSVQDDEMFHVVCSPSKVELWNSGYKDLFRSIASQFLRDLPMDPDY